MKVNDTHTSVFFQLYDNPVEAALLTLKSDLNIIAAKKIRADGIVAVEGVSAQTLDMVLTGKAISTVPLDELFVLVMKLGYTLNVNKNPYSPNPLNVSVIED